MVNYLPIAGKCILGNRMMLVLGKGGESRGGLDKRLWKCKLINVKGKAGSERLSRNRSFRWFDGIDVFCL